MSKIESREYKVMLDHRMFTGRKRAVRALWADLTRVAERHEIEAKGDFGKPDRRQIRFIDTADFAFRQTNLLLRIRQEADRAEFTLKCRSEDRYLAQGMNLKPSKGRKPEMKFEEDIAAPFRSRFSRSVTIDAEDLELPATVAVAAGLFPILGRVRCNQVPCAPDTPLIVVGSFTAHERVYKGPRFRLGAGVKATVAVILWSNTWKQRTVAAELSFRYGNDDEEYLLETVQTAFHLFQTIQTLDWCQSGGTTKTQFAYGGS